jgi:hypothetical protein
MTEKYIQKNKNVPRNAKNLWRIALNPSYSRGTIPITTNEEMLCTIYLCIMPGWRKPVAWRQLVRNSAEWPVRGILMKKPVTGPLDLASPGFRKQCSLPASFSSTALSHSKTEHQQRNSQQHTAKQHMSQRYTTQHGTTQHSTLNNLLVSAQKNVNQRIVHCTLHKQ